MSVNLPDSGKPPRAVAIDLDGTLLNSRSQLSERNRLALELCLKRGVPVIIATSRPLRTFRRVFPPDIAARCSYAVMNGAVAVGNPPLTGRYKENLPEDVLRSVISCALDYDPHVHVTLEIDGYEFGANWQWDAETLWQRNAATPDMVLTLEEAISRRPCKIALGNTEVAPLTELLERQFGEALSVVASKFSNALSRPIINVTRKTATKPAALCKLLGPVGVQLDDVLSFGDDLPDLEMLQACGMPVAMANAFPEVKAACAHHTASNDEDGVALVLERVFGNQVDV